MLKMVKDQEWYDKIHENPLFINTPNKEFEQLLLECKLRMYEEAEKSGTISKHPKKGCSLC